MEYIIETKNLTKTFPNKLAVDHVNMHVKRGDIYGFIGKNGAGKTTTMKLILGLINPSEGEITLFGSKDLNKQRGKLGSLIEAPGLYKNATAYENMKRFSIIYGGTDKEIKEILNLVGLGNVGNRKAGNFSLGMRQRLGIAIALVGNPEILILDEPTRGVDVGAKVEIYNIITELAQRGVAIIIVSSELPELLGMCDRIIVLGKGEVKGNIERKDFSQETVMRAATGIETFGI